MPGEPAVGGLHRRDRLAAELSVGQRARGEPPHQDRVPGPAGRRQQPGGGAGPCCWRYKSAPGKVSRNRTTSGIDSSLYDVIPYQTAINRLQERCPEKIALSVSILSVSIHRFMQLFLIKVSGSFWSGLQTDPRKGVQNIARLSVSN